MTLSNVHKAIRSVAIIDDDSHEADVISITVQDAGFQPQILSNGYKSALDVAKGVKKVAQAAICDNRLSPYGYAQFDGASVVAELNRQGVPALLVTQFVNQDSDVSIRKWRKHIPVLFRRDEVDEDRIAQGFDICLKEIRGEHLPGRKPWRSLVQIVDIRREDNQKVVDVIVPSWHPKESLRFPASLMPTNLRRRLKCGIHLFAMVNIGAEKAEELFFYDFELAPKPVPESELG